MDIRKFSDCDIDQILSLQEEWFNSDVLPPYVNRLLFPFFTEDNTIVVEDHNNIIGYSFFEINKHEKCYEIMYLYLSVSERKKGIGKYLVNYVETEIKKRGEKKIVLSPTTKTKVEKLVRYYTNLGYSRDEDRKIGGYPRIIMSKHILIL